MQHDEILRLFRAFEQAGLRYVLIGAAAMGFHGIVRATEDLDLFVEANSDNIERLRRALHAVYDDPNVDEISADDLLGEYPALRYYPPTGDLYLDIMTRLGEMADYHSVEREEKRLDGVRVTVATPRALFRLKRDTVRPLDRRDAELLRETFDLDDNEP